jgi:ABC-type cobalamin transport system permease subunit
MLHEAFFVAADSTLVALIFVSGCSGILITINSLLCLTLCGPVAVNICGILKDVVLTAVGFAFFKTREVTASTAIGIGLSFVGASYFLYATYQKRKQEEKERFKVH